MGRQEREGREDRGVRRKLAGERKVWGEKNTIRKREATMEGKKRMSGDEDCFRRRRKGPEEIGKDGNERTGRIVTVRGGGKAVTCSWERWGQACPPSGPASLYTLPAPPGHVQVPASANSRGEGQAISQ